MSYSAVNNIHTAVGPSAQRSSADQTARIGARSATAAVDSGGRCDVVDDRVEHQWAASLDVRYRHQWVALLDLAHEVPRYALAPRVVEAVGHRRQRIPRGVPHLEAQPVTSAILQTDLARPHRGTPNRKVGRRELRHVGLGAVRQVLHAARGAGASLAREVVGAGRRAQSRVVDDGAQGNSLARCQVDDSHDGVPAFDHEYVADVAAFLSACRVAVRRWHAHVRLRVPQLELELEASFVRNAHLRSACQVRVVNWRRRWRTLLAARRAAVRPDDGAHRPRVALVRGLAAVAN
mmetsp:Transcript_49717/g.128990  ORF Transcript_49717/g.128990 Transcript_49717/m.128990 type:complete len:292 (+) Transcript_49717:158-1033(+)